MVYTIITCISYIKYTLPELKYIPASIAKSKDVSIPYLLNSVCIILITSSRSSSLSFTLTVCSEQLKNPRIAVHKYSAVLFEVLKSQPKEFIPKWTDLGNLFLSISDLSIAILPSIYHQPELLLSFVPQLCFLLSQTCHYLLLL